MLLRARQLGAYADVNHFNYLNTASCTATAGSNFVVTFEIFDASVNPPNQGFVPPGLRYMPAVGATLVVTLASVDQAYVLVRPAVQPSPLDPSIWQLTFLPTDFPNGGTFSWSMVLTEPGPVITNGTGQFCLRIYPAAPPPNW